jgi:radical SAM superfamily enzyme YgiQ (UPF0313 family)
MASQRPDIVFVHPQGVNWFTGTSTDMTRVANIMPPLGILSLSAYLEKKGLHTEIIDAYAKPATDEDIADRVARLAPPFVGFTVTTSSFLQGERIARLVKERLPRAVIVFGGVHISALKETSLAPYPVIDYGVVGEGEKALHELMEASTDAQRAAVPGVIFRDGDGLVVFNGYREDLLDLDSIPFPAYHRLHDFPRLYQLPLFNYPKGPGTTMISARGCPYRCTFCDRSVFRASFRFNSADYIYEHVRFLKRNYRIRHINFYDDLFTLKRDRVLALADRLASGPLRITFNCAAQVNHIDAELLSRLKKAGCWMVSIGLETGDEGLLKEHKRGAATLEKGERALRLIKDAGLRAKGLFICGLPGETEETFARTVDFIRRNPIDDLNMTKFTPFAGAPAYENIAERGTFDEKWEEMNCTNFTFVPKDLTRARLEELYRDFHRNHYLTPRVWWNYITMLWQSPESWIRLLANINAFWAVRNQVKEAAKRAR